MWFDGFVHKAPIQLESSHCPGGQKTSGCETLAFAPWQHVPSYCWPSSSVRWASVLRSGPIVLGYSYHPASTCTTSARNGQAPVRNCQICVLRPFVCAIFSRLFACGSRAARRTLALPRLTRARASLAGECHLKDYMRVECCTSCRAAAALQEVTLFRPPFFRPPTHFSHASHTHSPHIPRFLFCLELCFRPPNRHLQKTRTKASSGSPSTGSPSTGAPSTGSPSTGSPSTGAPSTECHEQGPKAGSCEAPTLASAQMETSQNAATTSSPDKASTTSSADEASPPASAPASRGVLSRLLGVFKWCMTLVMLATIFLVARELSEAQIGPRAVDSMRDSEVCFSHEPIFPICHTPIFPIYHKHSFLRYFISLTNPVFPICRTQFFVYLAVFFVLALAA